MIDHQTPFTSAERREAMFLCELLKTVVPQLRATLGARVVILSEPGSRPAIAVNCDGSFLSMEWAEESEYLEVMDVVRACPDLRVVLDRIEEAFSDGKSPAAATVHRAKDALDSAGIPA
ncbi:MAG: hypothetical protein ABIP39_12190 [Polyangiaceae bacterium]